MLLIVGVAGGNVEVSANKQAVATKITCKLNPSTKAQQTEVATNRQAVATNKT